MAGTSDGNKRGAITKKNKFGADFYANIGARGGAKSLGKPRSEATKQKIRDTIRRKKEQNENNQTSS